MRPFPCDSIVFQSVGSEKREIYIYLHNNNIYHFSPSFQNTMLPSFPAAFFLPQDLWKSEKLKGMEVFIKDCFLKIVVLILALICSFWHFNFFLSTSYVCPPLCVHHTFSSPGELCSSGKGHLGR